MKLRMTKRERECLVAALEGSMEYLEFGSGGSTILALQHSRAHVVTVDSDPAWLDAVRKAAGEHAHRLRCVRADIGPTGRWGFPERAVTDEQAVTYHTSVWSSINLAEPKVCLVDGRFRLACALQAYAHLPGNSIILFHDFAERAHFAQFLEVAPKHHMIDSMLLMAVPEHKPIENISQMFEEVKTVPR